MALLKPKNNSRKELSITLLFPNFVTLLALCIGLSAIRFALAGKWELAAASVITAAVLDGMDGRIARLLKATSDFGAQLDSLADIINFGVVPAVVLYLWTLDDLNRRGWAAVLFFAVCCAIRLARFNSAIAQPKPAWTEKFFVGMAAPMGACMSIFFMVLSFEFDNPIFKSPELNAANLILIGLLMASRVPTFSIKKLAVKHENAVALMVMVASLFVLITIEPWPTLAAIGIGYMVSILFSSLLYLRLKHSNRPKTSFKANLESKNSSGQ